MRDDTRILRNIMVPLDGSPLAERALLPAAALAEATGAELHLVSVKPPVSTVSLPPESRGLEGGADTYLQKRMSEYLASQAAALPANGVPRVTLTVLEGWAPESLAAHAHATEIDLVVMTTHGRGGASRFWLGSVADELLRRTPCPVLLIRAEETGRDGEFRRILVALDGSPASEALVPPTLAIASLKPGASCTLAHVVEPPAPLLFRMAGANPAAERRWADEEKESAGARLEHLAVGLRKQGIPVEVRVVVGGGVAERIVGLASELKADLTVVGTYGARGLERIVLGSVADKVVRGSAIAVLVVPLRHALGESRTVKPDR